MVQESDEELAHRVQAGDQAAFATLVGRYSERILRYARRFLFGYEDAEDLTQQVFLKAYVNIQSFDHHRRFSPWIYRIAHNEFLNTIKRKHREPLPFFDPDTLFPHPVSRESADRDLLEKDLQAALASCLDTLPPKYREPIVLYYYQDLSYEEIADILQIPVATVGVRLKRAKDKLRLVYSELNPAYGQ